MISDKAMREEFVIRVLKNHIKRKRLASTYLFTGEETEVTKDLVNAFVASLNCDKGNLFKECSCSSCSRIFLQAHPDVRVLGGEDVKSIKIEEVRDVLNWVQLKPYEGPWKCLVVPDADRLTAAASNALLKTLEEPPGNTIFCLLAQSRSHLLETIQSRAFELRMRTRRDEENIDSLKGEIDALEDQNWDELLETYHTSDRTEVQNLFRQLLIYFRKQTESPEIQSQPELLAMNLQAFKEVYRAREALEANANQKLTLSWLAMKLMKIFSPTP